MLEKAADGVLKVTRGISRTVRDLMHDLLLLERVDTPLIRLRSKISRVGTAAEPF